MTERTNISAQSPLRLDYDSAAVKVSEEIRSSLKSAPPVIRRLTNHLARTGGKEIRAKALLACSLHKDGLLDSESVKAAAAVELLHLATLVHDDIIDNASKRRGIDTLHQKFGEKAAVLCGDYLFCLALQSASMLEPYEDRIRRSEKSLPGYMMEICLGEMRQDQNLGNFGLSEREYTKIIAGKTAALFEASFHLGFLLSDEPPESKSDYLKLGKNIGYIFQLADDCADYEATQKQSKKPVLSDYVQGVVTLPLIYALKADPQLRGRIDAGMTAQDLKSAVEAAGGLNYTHNKILLLYSQSKKIINRLDAVQEKKDLLFSLLEKATGMS